MKIDAQLGGELAEAPAEVARLAAMGLDGLFTFEGSRDVFLPLVLAAEHSELDLYTNVAIALPRNPMHLAYQAFDLQRMTGGRFALGLGSQIRPHIERRFGVEWTPPLGRMRSLVEAVKAIFSAWQDGTPLEHRSQYHQHTLMPPTFVPSPLEPGPPPIWLGALGPRMTAMAVEVGDGVVTHPFTTAEFVREHTMPNVAGGLASGSKRRADVTVTVGAIVGVWGDDDRQRQAIERSCRSMLGFYGSTPAYRRVLDHHGWGDIQPDLRRLTLEGRWDELHGLWDDEMVEALCVLGPPGPVARELVARFGDHADRLALSLPYDTSAGSPFAAADRVGELIAELAQTPTGAGRSDSSASVDSTTVGSGSGSPE